MKVSVTSIKLRNPIHVFTLISLVFGIRRQLKKDNCRGFKRKGGLIHFYTMTLWDDDEHVRRFADHGAHRSAMRLAGSISSEIRTITVSLNGLPSWKKAMDLLKDPEAKIYKPGVHEV